MTRFREQGGWWVAGQLGLFAILAAALLVAPSTEVPGDLVIRVCGGVIFLIGCLLGLLSFAHLGRQLTPYPKPIDGGELVERGLYARARHPIYGGVVLIALGSAIFDLNAVGLAVAALFVPFFWAKSGHEERLLAEQYPGYEEYRQRVRRRMIPWIL